MTTSHIMPTYGRLPITFDRGQGIWLWDNNNRRYLDALSGIAVCNLGHAHPAVHQAICYQSRKLLHTSNLYGIELQEQLADKLCSLSGMDTAFFCNSGAEANEAAIKLARLYGHKRGNENPAIIVMESSFHGRTLGALSATGNPKVQQGFGPLLSGFVRVPFNDVPAIETAIAKHDNIVALLVEPIQGEGGVNIPAPAYLNQIRDICDRHQMLMMVDEVQTGIGRTGKFLAYQHNGIKPDVCTLAKALGNGVPIGACLAGGKAAEILTGGTHGSTFGGNPLACSAALAVLDTLEQEQLPEQAAVLGQKIRQRLRTEFQDDSRIKEIRSQGLMIGIELIGPCAHLVETALTEAAVLINVTAERCIRLLPPLIIDDQQTERLVAAITTLIQKHFRP